MMLYGRTSGRSHALLLTVLPVPIIQLLLCYYYGTTSTMAFPMQIVVSQYTTECLYEQLTHEERATISAFILAGSELKASMTFEGPLPEEEGSTIDSGASLQTAIRLMEMGHKDERHIHFTETVDFEHLNIGTDDDENQEDAISDKSDNSEEDATAEQRRDRRQDQRKKVLEARQRQEQRKIQQRQKVRHEGEPIQWTFEAPGKGWYRYCITATWNQVTVEMDFRKESEMGGVDADGNVRTIAQKVVQEEEMYMEEDTAAKEGIKDEDFESTRTKLKELRHLLANIQSKQSQERHRITLHSVTNSHSHSRMVLGSLIETILFMLVTGYQVYTIRKWFKGAPVLAR